MRCLPLIALGLLLAGCPKKGGTDLPTAPTTGADTPGDTTPDTTPGVPDAPSGSSFEDRYAAAVAQLKAGDVESVKGAAATFQQLATERPELAEIPYNLGVAAAALGDLEGARKHYLRATDVDPKLGDAWLNLGALAERAGDLDRALSHYEAGLRHAPENEKLIVGIIGVLRKQGRTDEAISKAKAVLIKNANNVDAYNNLGLVYVDQGKLDLAKFIYQKALTIQGADQNALLHCNLGRVYLLSGETVLARQELERSLELDPNLVASLMFLANDRLDNRDWEGAAKYLERARTLEPENPAITMNLGIAYRGLGRFDDARAEYEKTLNLDRANPDPYLNLAVLQGDHLKQYDAALASIQKYRDSGGRDLARADAWQKDIEAQKQKYELQLERERRKKEREARDAERKRLAEVDAENRRRWEEEAKTACPEGQVPVPLPEGQQPVEGQPVQCQPAPGSESPEPAPTDQPAPTEPTPTEPTPTEPAPAEPTPTDQPAPTGDSPWGGAP